MSRAARRTATGEHPVDILGTERTAIERIEFPGVAHFRSRMSSSLFTGQDHWVVSSRLALDFGVRVDSQTCRKHSVRAAGIAWSPFAHTGTLVQAGYGLFFDRVPLNVYCFNKFPDQSITMYAPTARSRPGHFSI